MSGKSVAVRVDEHSFGALDRGEIPADTISQSSGLVLVMSAGALICTGIHTGPVRVRVATTDRAPERVDPGRWEEIVEATVYAPYGQLWVESLEQGRVAGLPTLSPAGRGWYRLRVHARGRDIAYDLVCDDPVEDYLLVGWPLPDPTTIIRSTDRTATQPSAAEATRRPAPDITAEERAERQRRQLIHETLLRASRKAD